MRFTQHVLMGIYDYNSHTAPMVVSSSNTIRLSFFKKQIGPFPASFFFIFVFSIQLAVNKYSINFADDWI